MNEITKYLKINIYGYLSLFFDKFPYDTESFSHSGNAYRLDAGVLEPENSNQF